MTTNFTNIEMTEEIFDSMSMFERMTWCEDVAEQHAENVREIMKRGAAIKAKIEEMKSRTAA